MNSSELILNNDGSIYHLNLKPGEVADTIITVGDPDRVGLVSTRFDTIQLRRQKREFVTHTGTLSGKRITVISTGIGTDNIDIVLNELHALKTMAKEEGNPYTIIRLGTSGAVQPQLKVDSLLISTAALGLDGLLHFYKDQHHPKVEELLRQNEKWQLLPKPYAAWPSDVLLEKYSPLCDSSGVTMTAPGFYGPQGRSIQLQSRIEGFIPLLTESRFENVPITNLEMETAGIYGLASLLGHKAISISALLANRVTGEFSEKADEVVHRMVEKTLDLMAG